MNDDKEKKNESIFEPSLIIGIVIGIIVGLSLNHLLIGIGVGIAMALILKALTEMRKNQRGQ